MTFDLHGFWYDEVDEHHALITRARNEMRAPFADMLAACRLAVSQGNKILFFGNGGSASDAQHLATELTVRYKKDRDPIAAIALSTDTSALTAIGNDLGFDQLFARQVAALGKSGDVAVGITTSGNSDNVIRAFEEARRQGLVTICLTGRDGGKIVRDGLCDIALVVPSQTTSRIQEMHILLGHMLCGALEQSLGLVEVDNLSAGANIKTA